MSCPKNYWLTNGTDEAIHLVCETYLEPGDRSLIVVPTYSMYEIYAAATGAKVVSIPAGEDFHFPVDAGAGRINERTRLIAIANPNNPTGVLLPASEIAPHRRGRAAGCCAHRRSLFRVLR